MGKRKFTTVKISEQPLDNQQVMPTSTQANGNVIYSPGMVQPAQNNQGIMHSGSQANGKASCPQGIMQPPQGNQQNMNSGTQASGEGSCSQAAQLTNKNKRGPTKMQSVWKLPNNKIIPLETNVNFQPCCKNTSTFSDYLGTLARNGTLLPLNYPTWGEVPETTKKHVLETAVKTKFLFPAEMEGLVSMSLGKKWRDWKYALKADHFDHKLSAEENIAKCPKNVQLEHWQYLVNYWKSPAGIKAEQNGQKARKVQKSTHITGSTSFAVRRKELEVKEGGEVGDLDFYVATHQRKDETWVDDSAKEVYKKAKALLDQRTTPTADSIRLQSEVLAEVQGKDHPGRVRGQGLGVTKTGSRGRKAQNQDAVIYSLTMHVAELQRQVAMLTSNMRFFPNAASTSSTVATPQDVAQSPFIHSSPD